MFFRWDVGGMEAVELGLNVAASGTEARTQQRFNSRQSAWKWYVVWEIVGGLFVLINFAGDVVFYISDVLGNKFKDSYIADNGSRSYDEFHSAVLVHLILNSLFHAFTKYYAYVVLRKTSQAGLKQSLRFIYLFDRFSARSAMFQLVLGDLPEIVFSLIVAATTNNFSFTNIFTLVGSVIFTIYALVTKCVNARRAFKRELALTEEAQQANEYWSRKYAVPRAMFGAIKASRDGRYYDWADEKRRQRAAQKEIRAEDPSRVNLVFSVCNLCSPAPPPPTEDSKGYRDKARNRAEDAIVRGRKS